MNRFIALSLGMILGGALLLGASFIIVKGDITMFNSKNSRYIEKTYECSKEIKDISVTESSGSVCIQKGDVDKVSVSYSDREEESMYEIRESGGKLNIEHRKQTGFHFFEISFTERKMVITVPEEFHGEVEVTNSSGSVRMDGIDTKKISVKNTSGSIKLENVTSEDSLSAKNTSGSIKLTDVEAGGDVEAENTSGSIRLENLRCGGDILLEATSGSIKGTIDGRESDYRIHAGVTSGSCNLKDTDQGDRKLDAHVSSGSIRIEFTQ